MRISAFILLIIAGLASCQTGTEHQQKSHNANQAFTSSPVKDSVLVDTFLIGNTRFRLLAGTDTFGDAHLYVQQQERWMLNLTLPYPVNGRYFDKDINQDGYNDFQNALLRGTEVYLFDTTLKRFYTTPLHFGFSWTLLDKGQMLYADHYETHGLHQTNLFRIKNHKQIYHYTTQIESTVKPGEETMVMRLYRIGNNHPGDTSFVTLKRINLLTDPFDYRAFWKTFMRSRDYRE